MGGFFGGGGGGASVDLASPPAIGNTTPNTGAFTTLSATPPANTTAFSTSGYSITGSGSTNLLDITGTWNTSGTPRAINVNITNTASNFDARLIDLRVGGTSRFFVQVGGGARFAGGFLECAVGVFNDAGSSNVVGFTNGFVSCTNITGIRWASGTNWQASHDLFLVRDGAAGTLAQRNSTNAQTFRLYNTYTDASNYERGFMRWATNVLEIGAEAAGTGTQRQLRFPLGTVTASTPLSITQTWNAAGTTFTGLLLNATDTASASGSLLMDLQTGGASQFTFRKNGIACMRFGFTAGSDVGIECYSSNDSAMSRTVSARCNMLGNTASGLRLSSGHAVSWSSNNGSTADVFQNNDLFILRDDANILAQRNSTNAQTFRLYNTFTSSTNFERLNLRWASNEFILDAEKGSVGGTLRGVKIGSATTSLLGFYGVTPVDQPATVTDPTGGLTVDAEARTAINAIIDRLQELGLVA